jgi:hypothetical protein
MRGQIIFKTDLKEVGYDGEDWNNVTQRFLYITFGVYKEREFLDELLNKHSASWNWLRLINYSYKKTGLYVKKRPRKCNIFITIVGTLRIL